MITIKQIAIVNFIFDNHDQPLLSNIRSHDLLNIYDKKQVRCITCERFIGEVESDAKVIFSRCGHCLDSDNSENEIFTYIEEKFENTIKNVIAVR